MTSPAQSVPERFCECGCGQKISRRATRYVHGHNAAHPRVNMADAAPFKIDGVYCKLIPLNRGTYAIVDAADFDRLNRYHWTAIKGDRPHSCYAVCQWVRGLKGARGTSQGRVLILHREILGLQPGDPRQGDHISGVTLDCRRDNLRIAAHGQNQYNRAKGRNNTSGFKGVCWCSRSSRWVARIQVDKRMIRLGCFVCKENAIEAYRRAEAKHFQEFARSL